MVTGGAGFIGSHLCDALLELGHQLVIIDDLSLGRRSNIGHLLERNDVQFLEMSILDEEFAARFKESRVDAVFHLAANSDIAAGSSDRSVDLDRTFMTTWQVLENMAREGVQELVFASTSAIYGDTEVPTNEDFGPLQPVSFYGAAKLASEAYATAYAARHDIRTWTVRFPNVIGSRATHGVIFDFVSRLLADNSVLQVLGDGTQTKPYLHVSDLVAAILKVWHTVDPQPYDAFNIAPTTATSVKRIAESVVETMGLCKTPIEYGSEPIGWPGDVPRFSYDTSKIQALGWHCELTSDEAVARAAAEIHAELRG